MRLSGLQIGQIDINGLRNKVSTIMGPILWMQVSQCFLQELWASHEKQLQKRIVLRSR